MTRGSRTVLPGLGLGLTFTSVYLALLVVVPLAACLVRAAQLTPAEFAAALNHRALAAIALTFGTSVIAALVDVVLGLLIAWVLIRYDFPFRKLADALVDLPFALPTAVAGLVYANLYAGRGWIGQWLEPLGIEVAYTRLGIIVVLVFLGIPFVVRTVQPVLEGFDAEVEEAAASLGATRWQSFRMVLFPQLTPALTTGFALALARGLGEYGSVIFISGNKPFHTEIASKLIVEQLEQFNDGGATAIAVVLLIASFSLLGVVNFLERRRARLGSQT
jgi:sulfate transport system permease protein